MSGEADPRRVLIPSRLRLFFSIDIVGSTRFKHRDRALRSDSIGDWWVYTFLSFYRQSVESVADQWAAAASSIEALKTRTQRYQLGPPPDFWKGAGDEVLFTKIVASPQDALAAVTTAIAVMRRYRLSFQKAEHTQELDVKGAAWLAGFPVHNTEIAEAGGRAEAVEAEDPVARNFRLLAASARPADFIGPSIDLGFRLREHAEPRRFLVSADLAWLLACAERKITPDHRARCEALRLPPWGFGGRAVLRGILDDEPYPLFWLQGGDGRNEMEKAELKLVRPATTDAVRDYCTRFLTNDSPYRSQPYMPACDDDDFAAVPPDHRQRLDALTRHVNGATERVATVAKSDRRQGDIPAAAQAFEKELLSTLKPAKPKPRPRRP